MLVQFYRKIISLNAESCQKTNLDQLSNKWRHNPYVSVYHILGKVLSNLFLNDFLCNDFGIDFKTQMMKRSGFEVIVTSPLFKARQIDSSSQNCILVFYDSGGHMNENK
jgi:hypothetical protein